MARKKHAKPHEEENGEAWLLPYSDLMTLLLALLALFILGGLWQHYAEGMWFLALCLLTRYWSHTRNDK